MTQQYISELIDIEKTSKEKIMQMIRIQTQLKQYETN